MELENLTIASLRNKLIQGEFSAAELTKEYIKSIHENDESIGAFLEVFEETAKVNAEEIDARILKGEELPPLAGVPLAIKDNLLIKGTRTTAASHILESYDASYDATVTEKLRSAGAVFLGKTNLDEFAMGASTEHSAFGVTKNPYDTERVAGGSSGGSAAAVAAQMALGAIGSDTGGSIRQPAAFCGVVGMKPTYGAVSRSGLIAMASSLDQIGPLGKTVEDVAILYDAIRGKDPYDATSVETDPVRIFNLERVKKFTVGVPKEYFIDGLHEEVQRGVEEAITKLKTLGVKFKEISLPHTRYAISTYYIVMPAEVSSNLARFDGIRYARSPHISRTHADLTRKYAENDERIPRDSANPRWSALWEIYFRQRGREFGAEVRRRILLGTFVLSSGYYDAYYTKAQKVRQLIARDFSEAFKEVDVVLAPVTPTPAFKIGEKSDDPLAMYLADVFTAPVNLAGLPSISIPVKKYKIGEKTLPIAFQLIGKHFHENDILSIGGWYEKE